MDTLPTNGVLTRVLADEVASALHKLPTASSSQPQTMQADAHASLLRGDVRITFRLNSHKRGKSLHYFWSAFYAELLSSGQQNS